MTFEATRKNPTQEHFYIIEIDLPIITGLCELTVGVEGFGTPLSCPVQDGTSATVIQTYRFCTPNMPILAESPVYRHVAGVSENATELQVDKGLAFRGRATITFEDFKELDPNPEREAGVAVKDQGTFFGKFKRRNVFEGREVRIIKFRKSDTLDISTDGQISYYTARELKTNGKGRYQLTCVDELGRIEFDQAQIPPEQDSFLRLDITDSVTTIPVDSVTDWNQQSTPYVIRIGEEYLTVTSVANNQTASAELGVATRGGDVGSPEFTNELTQTINEEHTSGDDVFICITFDGTNIATALSTLLTSVDVPSSIIPITDWLDEVAIWHPTDTVIGIYDEAIDADLAILKILEPFLMQMWMDPIDREIKLKAISQWVESSSTVTEGKEIDFESLSTKDVERLRYSRAFIVYDKPFLANPEEATSYKKRSLALRPELETIEFFGTKPKVKKFNRSTLINKATADLLTSRYVQRFGLMPVSYLWKTQEKNLNFKVGDVVNVKANDVQGFDGLQSDNTRAQILKIQPILTPMGREYKVNALTYQPAISSGAVFTINSATELNLFVLAGAPPIDVDVTFIFDGGLFRSTDTDRPSVKAGGFSAGSSIIIILRNGADWQSKGGTGGSGGASLTIGSPVAGGDGGVGGICYDAQGVDTDIYLAGADPESGTADGNLRSPGGGGGGSGGVDSPSIAGGSGGGGGAGVNVGEGGTLGASDVQNGLTGLSGDTLGNGGDGVTNSVSPTSGDGGDWGEDGSNASGGLAGSGGLKGKGLVKNGATVRVFGDTPSNFINGGGDSPDP